ncbi:hypothetical protein CLOBOL_03327 [Enterocloster bolteae ATCC BAA-613]|uniref:Uncharacterized protein n=1 Tax=Enterocloster bolteae (strain ATCC BAA-613 / DSM 15670 / CCUG 46953 / JCM 12243 / WAL 16351) TaxID=411902 RepID=A8RSH8_ENTBW|nr:hypothetical protein CLOBOL_03327 [Enterocloster bolteae ATCC BAA-613]
MCAVACISINRMNFSPCYDMMGNKPQQKTGEYNGNTN